MFKGLESKIRSLRRYANKAVLSRFLLSAAVAAVGYMPMSPRKAEAAETGKIVYVSNRDNNNNEIYVMNGDGSNQTRLTTTSGRESDPAVSPDGKKIAYFYEDEKGYGLYVMNIDETNKIRLTNSADMHPTWSPDGSKIASESFCDKNKGFDIYVMNSDGSNQVNLTNDETLDSYPAWSPNGKKIAFSSMGNVLDDIFVMNADGTNKIMLTDDRAPDQEPTWSPDGTKIAFSSTRNGDSEIYVMNADGSNETNLTKYRSYDINRSHDFSPAWSPDGTKIAFVSTRDGNREIYVMNTDGSNQVNITKNPAMDEFPSWQRGTGTSTQNNLPIANISGATQENVPASITFDGSSSYDSDGSITKYEWDVDGDGFDDGTNKTVSRTFTQPGKYNIMLRVTDDKGATSTKSLEVIINEQKPNLPPIANISGITEANAPTTITFDGSSSYDSDGSIAKFEWDVDGDGFDDGTNKTLSRLFSQPGKYYIMLRVTDNKGATGTKSLEVIIKQGNRSPVASFTANPTTGVEPLNVTFDASSSYDPDDDRITMYQWDFDGDGIYDGSGKTIIHLFTQHGKYNVVLKVYDEHNASDTETKSLEILESMIKDDETSPFYKALGFIFDMNPDIWQERDELEIYHKLKSQMLDNFIRSDLPPLEITWPAGGSVVVGDTYFDLVQTNMPYIESIAQGMNASAKQRAVINAKTGEFVYDPEIIFKVLFTRNVQKRFSDKSFRAKEAKLFNDLADKIGEAKKYHGIANVLDAAQGILSKMLANQLVSKPLTAQDIKDLGIDLLKNSSAAIIANIEMARISSELRENAEQLNSPDFEYMNYEESSAFYTDYANLRSKRIPALVEFAKATFPGNEESEQLGPYLGEMWYTIKKVRDDLKDVVDMGEIPENIITKKLEDARKKISENQALNKALASYNLIQSLIEIFEPVVDYYLDSREHDGFVGEQIAYAEAFYIQDLLRSSIDPSKKTNTFVDLGRNAVLEVPFGAVDNNVFISVKRLSEKEISEAPRLSEGIFPVLYEIGPSGLVFNTQHLPTITINYKDSEIRGADESSLRIFTYNSDKGLWLPLEGPFTRNSLENIISTQIRHLSLFGLGVVEGEQEGKLVFGLKKESDYGIYVMEADGSNLVKLLDNNEFDSNPQWSPDGERIVFMSRRDGEFDIYVMDKKGGNLINLTNDSSFDNHPVWSSDGKKIAFVSNHIPYIINADGTNRIMLYNGITEGYLSWSPDGKKIAFVLYKDNNYEIYTICVDGTNLKRLTNNPDIDKNPVWSPDGKKIAFESRVDDNYEIYIINSDGTNLNNLTNNSKIDNNPVWSPDGKKIAFESYRDGKRDIYVMNADGTNLINLTNNLDGSRSPEWSSDGRKIAFVSIKVNKGDICIINADGTSLKNLTNNPSNYLLIDWQPISISNRLPIAYFTAEPKSGFCPLKVKLDAGKSSDLDGKVMKYEWDLNGDSKPDTTGAVLDHVFSEQGVYPITLLVTDNKGGTDSCSLNVVVTQDPKKFRKQFYDAGGNPVYIVKLDGITPLTEDFEDFIAFAKSYNAENTNPNYNRQADPNDDGIVNFPDFVSFVQAYGREASTAEKPAIAASKPTDLESRIEDIKTEKNADVIDIGTAYFSADQQTQERFMQYAGKIGGSLNKFAEDVRQFDLVTALDNLNIQETVEYRLGQNIPNPFNPNTIIPYSIEKDGNVSLRIYNILGQEVRTLVNEQQQLGNHQATWDGADNSGRDVANGVYLYRIEVNGFSSTRKMVFVK